MTKEINVTLPAELSRNYTVSIGAGLLDKISWLNSSHRDIVILTDNTVKKYYAKSLLSRLEKKGHRVLLLSFAAGENAKNSKTKEQLEEKMLTHHYARDSIILALGGGVVGDMAGFIAATYMRGIPYIQLPTTLLAMIDSSVGGKTGINTQQGKNLIGAFWQPLTVISDVNVLKTLPKKHITAGLIEAIKVFLTSNKSLFAETENQLSKIIALHKDSIINVIHSAVAIKADVVSEDEKETGKRMILNFGHTIGHALEKLTNYKMLHGHAVGYGILMEAKISEALGLLPARDFLLIETLLGKLNITKNKFKKYSIKEIMAATQSDKKTQNSKVRYVLLKSIGSVYSLKNDYAHPVPDKIIEHAFLALTGAKNGRK